MYEFLIECYKTLAFKSELSPEERGECYRAIHDIELRANSIAIWGDLRMISDEEKIKEDITTIRRLLKI